MIPNTQQTKKRAMEFAAFITDVAKAMQKHNVKDMLCVFGMNGDIRNTYIPLSDRGELPLYCKLSDGIHEWLQIKGAEKSDTPKFTGSIKIKKSYNDT